jgi:phosphoserine aminotransferase
MPSIFAQVDFDRDVVFTWNGTTSGVRVPNGDWIPADREGPDDLRRHLAAFAQDLDWDKLDVTTFSWQKVLGGEGGARHADPEPPRRRAAGKLHAAWPLPKIFRLTKGGKLIEGIFKGETINTPSMLCVEDYLTGADWAKSIGGLRADRAGRRQCAGGLRFCADATGSTTSPVDPATRSNTSVCLKFTDIAGACRWQAAFAKAMAKRLEAEGVALDIGAYRDAPPGLRIWCGATVETSDIEALMPWLDWAFAQPKGALKRRPPEPPGRLPNPSGRAGAVPAGPAPRFPAFRPYQGGHHGPRVLVSDKLSETAVQIFRDRGIDVDFMPSSARTRKSCSKS